MSDHLDLAPITRHLRAMYTSRLLVAAVTHLRVFEQFTQGPCTFADLQRQLHLKDRPAKVLFPALCAMGLLECSRNGLLSLTELGSYLIAASQTNLIGYVGLEAEDPGVREMVERLRNDGPRNAE